MPKVPISIDDERNDAMTQNRDQHQNQPDVETLDMLLLAYGADRSRWPADAQARAALIRSTGVEDPAIRRLARETTALDHLLASAATTPATPATQHLADRIMAALPARATVTAAAGPTIATSGTRAMPSSQAIAAAARPRVWIPMPLGAATALAASLLLGIIVGTAGHDTGIAYDVTTRLGITDLVYAGNGWGGDGGPTGDEEDTL